MPLPPEHTADAARILVVDGDPTAAARLAAGLAEALGAQSLCRLVATGRDAAETLRTERFDLVFAELKSLGDLAATAEEAIGRLVRLAEGALTVALSDGVSVSAAVAALRAGAHDFAARPISAESLAGRIRELARRHGKSALLPADDHRPPDALIAELTVALGQLQAAAGTSGMESTAQLGHLRDIALRLAATVEETTGPAPAAPPPPATARRVLPMWQQEQRIIEEAVALYSGNIALAAAALELSPSTIYRKRQAWAGAASGSGAA